MQLAFSRSKAQKQPVKISCKRTAGSNVWNELRKQKLMMFTFGPFSQTGRSTAHSEKRDGKPESLLYHPGDVISLVTCLE
eukprot:jgi/Pico_ML_1/55060/g813.t1